MNHFSSRWSKVIGNEITIALAEGREQGDDIAVATDMQEVTESTGNFRID